MAGSGDNSVRHGISFGLGLMVLLHFSVCVQAGCFPWPWTTICKLKEAEEARAKAVIAEEQRYQDFWNGLRYFRNAQKLNESRFEDIESRRILKPLLPFRPQSGSSSFARTDNFEREFKSLTKKMENYFKNTTGEFGRYFEAKLERLHPRTEALLNRYYKYMET